MLSQFETARVQVWSGRVATRSSGVLRVLIVDDLEVGADAIAAYLTIETMECRIALGGLEAISTGTSWRPDVFVMDISMPTMNGFEATHLLRRDIRTSNAVVVAYTALDEAEVRQKPMSHAFDGYCQKGQSPAALVALIEHFTG